MGSRVICLSRGLLFSPRGLSFFSHSSPEAMSAAAKFVDDLVSGKPVVMFSKSYCPFCTKAKKALAKHIGDRYELVEIENRPDCAEIQAHLKKITGASSVPRVFIGGKCIGGGDETGAADASGKLAVMLKDAGAK